MTKMGMTHAGVVIVQLVIECIFQGCNRFIMKNAKSVRTCTVSNLLRQVAERENYISSSDGFVRQPDINTYGRMGPRR